MNYLLKKIVGLLLLLPLTALAQAPSGYYSAANGKSGAELKTALHEKIKGHTQRSYANLWTDFVRTDSRADGKVWDMYSNCNFTWGTGAGGNQDQGSGGGSECQFYNREHSFPKSWFGIKSGQENSQPYGTDLFHLIPTDKRVNNQRGNLPYGEVGTVSQSFINGSKIGKCSFAGYTGGTVQVFEPIDEYKGDFARSYLYMVTRYEDVVVSWYNYADAKPMLNGTAHPAFQAWAISMLLKWHRQDTVSAKEVARNDSIYKIQNNRNPFIDHPELAEYIWGDSTAYAWSRGGTATAVPMLTGSAELTLYPNPVTSEQLTVTSEQWSVIASEAKQSQAIEIYNLSGALMATYKTTGEKTNINISQLPNGAYLLKVGKSTAKFVKQ